MSNQPLFVHGFVWFFNSFKDDKTRTLDFLKNPLNWLFAAGFIINMFIDPVYVSQFLF